MITDDDIKKLKKVTRSKNDLKIFTIKADYNELKAKLDLIYTEVVALHQEWVAFNQKRRESTGFENCRHE